MNAVIARLRESSEARSREVTGISDAQWTWRGADGRWTVQENLEHLILVERGGMILPRRAIAPERVRPLGTWGDRVAAMAEFERLRSETIGFASAAASPLRERSVRLPVGELDGVQVLLMLAGHSLRHLAQIRAVRRGGA